MNGITFKLTETKPGEKEEGPFI